jgi:hypothetical protein
MWQPLNFLLKNVAVTKAMMQKAKIHGRAVLTGRIIFL